MAATGKTPILLYGSTTPTNAPTAGNLTNSTNGCEIAINIADKNLFFKDSTNAVNTVPIRQSSASSNGWLSSADWNTFNNKQPAGSYALTTGTLAQFAATTSAQLAGVISDETGSGSLVFGTSPTIATPTLTGNVTISDGNLVIGTSGKGIDFSATAGTGTSELLADYEEGNWTPVIRGSGTAGTESGSKNATYTKIGNRVMARLSLTAYTLSGATGNITLTGLPFTARWNGIVAYAEGFTPAFTAAIGSGGALTLSSTTSTGATEAGFRPSVSASWDNYMTSASTWTGGGGSTYMHIELWGTV